MKPSKKLSLRREAMTDLTPGQLVGIAGASGTTCPFCPPTIRVECPSDPVVGCTIIYETRDGCLDTITCPTDVC